MQWTDEAIILSARKYGENKALVRLFARHHGVHAGIARGAFSKTNRGIWQPGNTVSVTWQARLAEHIGSFRPELLAPFAAQVMGDKMKLAALASACALLEVSLPERHPYPRLYAHFHAFLTYLVDRDEWQDAYVRLELEILSQSGFGLDLTACAATGMTENLAYVSPKSGRAVSHDAGQPYKDKLLPLPPFLRLAGHADGDKKMQETLAGLRLTGYFLETRLSAPHGKKLPAARARLVTMMKEEHGQTEN